MRSEFRLLVNSDSKFEEREHVQGTSFVLVFAMANNLATVDIAGEGHDLVSFKLFSFFPLDCVY